VNEVTALSDGTSFTYDDNGNRTQKTKGSDTWDYTYDYANRLTKVEENQSTLGEYVYTGNGKRIQATENSVTTTYIYIGNDVFYEENTTGTAAYIYGPTGRIAKRTTINQQSNTYFYHTDHLDSTRLITDTSKTIIAAVTYHPFGATSTDEGSEHMLYTGKEEDTTGLHYYNARYYDSDLGRFISRDILPRDIESPQSLNRYTYCLNNPMKYIDPDGKIEKKFAIDGNVGTGYKPPIPEPPPKPEGVTADNLEEKLQEYTEAEEQYEKDLAAWKEVFAPCHGGPCIAAPPEEDEDPLPTLPPDPNTPTEEVNDWYGDETQKDPTNDFLDIAWLIAITLALIAEAVTDEEEPTKSGGNSNHAIC
jgi:RHS repeat-associated protein